MVRMLMTLEKAIEKILFELLQSVGVFLFSGVLLFGVFGLFGLFTEQSDWGITPIIFTVLFIGSLFKSLYSYYKLKRITKRKP